MAQFLLKEIIRYGTYMGKNTTDQEVDMGCGCSVSRHTECLRPSDGCLQKYLCRRRAESIPKVRGGERCTDTQLRSSLVLHILYFTWCDCK